MVCRKRTMPTFYCWLTWNYLVYSIVHTDFFCALFFCDFIKLKYNVSYWDRAYV